jgi:neutral ceramidase
MLFLQGAAGNINPLLMGENWSNPKVLGLQLGAEILRVCENLPDHKVGPDDDVIVATTRQKLDLPGLVMSNTVEDAEARITRCELEQAEAQGGANVAGYYWAGIRLAQARRDRDVLLGNSPKPVVRIEIAAARVGPVGLVTAPGEVFCEIGMAITRRSPFGLTLYSGYSNGNINYIPTDAAHSEGGYEVENACMVARGAGELLESVSLALLGELAKS